jgi:hypothetical protein
MNRLAPLLLFLSGCSTLPTISPADLPRELAKGPCVVMFCKPLCPPCDAQAAELSGITGEFPMIRFVKVYAYDELIRPTDANMVKRYNLKWTPTTVLHVNGHHVSEWVRYKGANAIRPALEAVKAGKVVCTPEGCKVVE